MTAHRSAEQSCTQDGRKVFKRCRQGRSGGRSPSPLMALDILQSALQN